MKKQPAERQEKQDLAPQEFAQKSGYFRVACQMESRATVELWFNPQTRTFYAIADGAQLWGPFSEAQLLTASNLFADAVSMQGVYRAIPT